MRRVDTPRKIKVWIFFLSFSFPGFFKVERTNFTVHRLYQTPIYVYLVLVCKYVLLMHSKKDNFRMCAFKKIGLSNIGIKVEKNEKKNGYRKTFGFGYTNVKYRYIDNRINIIEIKIISDFRMKIFKISE